MNLQSTDFELFQLPAQFAQQGAVLDARWKDLQREVHPDKFASEGTAAQRLAMQWSARINEAYRRLKDPLKRASYLCELNGAPIQAHSNTAMPPQFLMQQMAWREALEDSSESADLQKLADETGAAKRAQLELIARTLDLERDFTKAAEQVRSLMFIEKFSAVIEARIDQFSEQ